MAGGINPRCADGLRRVWRTLCHAVDRLAVAGNQEALRGRSGRATRITSIRGSSRIDVVFQCRFQCRPKLAAAYVTPPPGPIAPRTARLAAPQLKLRVFRRPEGNVQDSIGQFEIAPKLRLREFFYA